MNYFSVFLGTPLSGHWSRSMCFLVMFCESIGRNLCVEIPQSHPLCSTGNSNDFGICWLWNRNFLLNCGHFGVLERRWTRLFPIFSRGWAKERWGHTSTAHLHLLSMPRPGVHPQKKIRGHQLLLTKHWYAHNVIIVVSFIRFFLHTTWKLFVNITLAFWWSSFSLYICIIVLLLLMVPLLSSMVFTWFSSCLLVLLFVV
jgi:hypothetical protein